jgi:hypothetical protein
VRPGLPRTRAARSLLAVAGALLLLRVLLLLAALEPAEERVVEVFDPAGLTWNYGPERPLFDREELYTGTAAEAMRRGLPLPASTYQFMQYGGGSLLTAWAARLVYTVFGESYLAFKLLPLLVAVGGGLFWFAAVRRAFGERLAWAFVALYALGPSTFVRTSLIAKGDHAEAMAWIGLVLWAALRAARIDAAANTRQVPRTADGTAAIRVRGAADDTTAIWAGVAGLAAGFGVFITYSTVPTLAGIFLTALLLTRARPARLWAFGAGGLALGLLPWIVAVVATGGGALEVYGRTLGSAASAIGSRVTALLGGGFFANYDLPGGTPVRQVAGLVFLLAVTLGWVTWGRQILAEWRRTRTGAAGTGALGTDVAGAAVVGADVAGTGATGGAAAGPAPSGATLTTRLAFLALVGTGAHLAAFVVTAPDVASRYVVPVYPLLLIAVARLLATPTDPRIPADAPAGTTADPPAGATDGTAAATAGSTDALAPASMGRPAVGLRGLGGLVVATGGVAFAFVLATSAWTATRLPLAGTDWPLLGEVVGQKLGPAAIVALPEDVRPHFWVGFGKKVFALTERDSWPEGVALAPEGEQGAVWEGIGIALVEGGGAFSEGPRIQALPSAARDAIVRGMARYGEVAFAAVAVNRPDVDLGAAELRMTGTPSEALAASRARSVATLAVHGASVSANAWQGLDPEVARRAVGIARFAGAGGSIRRHPVRGEIPVQAGDDDPALWQGLGAAFGQELSVSTLSLEQRRERIAAMSADAPAAARAGFVSAAETGAGVTGR